MDVLLLTENQIVVVPAWRDLISGESTRKLFRFKGNRVSQRTHARKLAMLDLIKHDF